MKEIKYTDYMEQVERHIVEYVTFAMQNAKACAYCLKSRSPFDLCLFSVIGYQVINGTVYWCVWDTWNESTRTLNNGTYMLEHDEAWKMFDELNRGYYKSIDANFYKGKD